MQRRKDRSSGLGGAGLLCLLLLPLILAAAPGGSGCVDVDGDGLCVPDDCYDLDAACTTSCVDADGDGVPVCGGDCDDTEPCFTTDCSQPDPECGDFCIDGVPESDENQDGDPVPDCADNCPMLTNASQADDDQDGIGNLCDCDLDVDSPGTENDGECVEDCTLLEALTVARQLPMRCTIRVPSGTYDLAGHAFDGSVSLLGAGADRTTLLNGFSIAGDSEDVEVFVGGATLTGGTIRSENDLQSQPGLLILSNVRVLDTTVVVEDGFASLWLNKSIVAEGPAIVVEGGVSNGVFVSGYGVLRVNRSTIRDNVGSGIGGGIELRTEETGCGDGGRAVVRNSTIHDNVAVSGGGVGVEGTEAEGCVGGWLELFNSTVAGNQAGDSGGGVFVGESARADIKSTTIAGNQANAVGGVLSFDANVILLNSLIAGNLAQGSDDDCEGRFTAWGPNLIADADGCNVVPFSDVITGVDPLLGPLGSYGGFTETLVPAEGSPAIGEAIGCAFHCPNYDQRGVPRTVFGGRELGSVEIADDGDGDGVPDVLDGCPADPAKTLPGICGCGVVDSLVDSDDDSIADCLDPCPQDPDQDGDGYGQIGDCGPGQDCDDANPSCTLDCTDVDADGVCGPEDCDDADSRCTFDCTDADGDGWCVGVDCDDSSAGCVLDCTDADGDGWCLPNDCDDSLPGCSVSCVDADADGLCPPLDCDDTLSTCGVVCADIDGDGIVACAGDCDDANPNCTLDCTDLDGDGHCVGIDCDDAAPGCTVDCTDVDGDGFCSDVDCDDSRPFCTSSCSDGDGDGYCAGVDCNDNQPSCTTDCSDADGDGVCAEADCDDQNVTCSADCTDDDGDAICPPFDCDDTNPWCGFSCVDGDSDGACLDTDCDDAEPAVFPEAPETNDGLDNQCPGDVGHGATDEISGEITFPDPDTYSWPAQAGATLYVAARASFPDFTIDCVAFPEQPGTSIIDTTVPDIGEVLFYLSRPVEPNPGSWGLSSTGLERVVPCVP